MNYKTIDLIKYLAAIAVIWLHVNPLYSISKEFDYLLVNGFCRFAVPFFFSISGYLFFKKLDPVNPYKQLFNYNKKIILFYISWTLIYMIIRTLVLDEVYIFNSTFLRKFIFESIPVHLWYLPALIMAISLVFILLNYLSIKKIVIIALIFLIIGGLKDAYSFLVKDKLLTSFYEWHTQNIGNVRNGLFFGFFWVAFGAYLAQQKIIYNSLSKKFITAIILISVIVTLETYFLYEMHPKKSINISIGSSLLAIWVILFSIQYPISYNLNYGKLRAYSGLLYFSHFIPIIFFKKYLSDYFSVDYVYIFRFLFTLIFSHLISYLLLKIPIKYRFFLG